MCPAVTASAVLFLCIPTVQHTICDFFPQEAVRVLIRHSADVNARDKNWQTPLHVAAANNALRCAEVIIPLLSSVNVSDRGGRTALHHAALNGHTEVLQRSDYLHEICHAYFFFFF